jgi:PhnB protein
MSTVRPIPEGYHTVTPTLTLDNAAEAIEFYKRAFGAQELGRAPAPDGERIWHAELQIGDSRLMLNDEFPDMSGCTSPKSLGGSTIALHVYVENADAVYQQALDAGATVLMPIDDMFWGDRYGKVRDPFGHVWTIGTHKADMSEEDQRRAVEAYRSTSGG